MRRRELKTGKRELEKGTAVTARQTEAKSMLPLPTKVLVAALKAGA